MPNKYILLFFTQFVVFLSILIFNEAQDSCIAQLEITSQDAAVGTPAEISSSEVYTTANVSETTQEDGMLYIISWQDDLATEPYTNTEDDDDGVLEFVSYNTTGKSLSVNVDSSMVGLVDYNAEERQEILRLSLYFEFSSLDEPVCKLQINHILIDENTQDPFLEDTDYEISIREDFPANLPIPDFQPVAYDFDAMAPNNVFSINMDAECPLEPKSSEYSCEEGQPVIVQFLLSTTLDYDTMQDPFQISCSITLIDKGTPSRNSTSNVLITVLPYADELPSFADGTEYFKGFVPESAVGTVVNTEPTIAAQDQDVPPSVVTFSMTSADSSVNGDMYFAINDTTGVITVTQDIDNEFLSFRSVDFIVKACDADSQCCNAFLNMELPTVSSNSSFLQFERITYSTQIYTPASDEQILRVQAQTSENEDDVKYSFVEDGSIGLEYFSIDEVSGWITATTNDTPSDSFTMHAKATVGDLADQTQVNIDIAIPLENIIMMKESVVMMQVEENNATFLLTVEAEGANFYCIVACWPETWFSSFELNNDTGELSIVDGLDADNSDLGNEVTLKVAAYEQPTNCPLSNISNQLMSYEELIGIAIVDVDEFAPTFLDAGGSETDAIMYAFPKEKALQKTIGPVATAMVTDADKTQETTFSISSTGMEGSSFIIDEDSGEIYLVGELQCENFCNFTVVAHDSTHNSELDVYVMVLDLDHIYTIQFENSDVDEIGNALTSMSAKTGASIYLLYQSVISGSTDTKAANTWVIEAQVYAVQGMDLLDLNDFNKILEDAGVASSAQPFSDREYYQTPLPEKDFKTATIVLGCVLGFVLLLAIAASGFAIWKKKNNGSNGNSPISTLGKVYNNHGFKDENEEPSFSTIFGDNPVEITPTYDTQKATTSTQGTENYSTFRDQTNTRAEPQPSTSKYYISSRYTSPKDNIAKENDDDSSSRTYEIYNYDVNLSEKPSDVDQRSHHEEEVEVHSSPIYPSEEVSTEKEMEITSSSSLSSEPKQSPLLGDKTSALSAGSSPEKDDVSVNSEKKSNIKLYPDADYGDEEPKSVAFKVLVDAKIIQNEKDTKTQVTKEDDDVDEITEEEDKTQILLA